MNEEFERFIIVFLNDKEAACGPNAPVVFGALSSEYQLISHYAELVPSCHFRGSLFLMDPKRESFMTPPAPHRPSTLKSVGGNCPLNHFCPKPKS